MILKLLDIFDNKETVPRYRFEESGDMDGITCFSQVASHVI